jgi:hypothetical protein
VSAVIAGYGAFGAYSGIQGFELRIYQSPQQAALGAGAATSASCSARGARAPDLRAPATEASMPPPPQFHRSAGASAAHLRRRDAPSRTSPSSAATPGAGTTEKVAVLTAVFASWFENERPIIRVKL